MSQRNEGKSENATKQGKTARPHPVIRASQSEKEEEKRKEKREEKYSDSGGTDWLEYRCFVEWKDWDNTGRMLSAAKEAAKENESDAGAGLLAFGTRVVLVGSKGAGKGFSAVEYLLSYEGMTIGIAKSPTPKGEVGNVFVRASGLVLLARGSHSCDQIARDLIKAMGGEILQDKMTRGDVCVDLPGVSMETIKHALNMQYLVRRAKMIVTRTNGTKLETVELGKRGDGIFCRIYDKLAEVKNQSDKLQLMVNRRWGGKQPKSAIRVEFEVSRESLREHGILTVADFHEHLAALTRYLVEEWLRFTADKPRRWLEKMAPLAGWWKRVQAAFVAWAGRKVERPEPVPKSGKARLLQQALGCMASMAAHRGFMPTNAVDAFEWVMGEMYANRSELKEKLRDKCIKLGFHWEKALSEYEEAGTDFTPDSPNLWGIQA